jgi:hypothetical protein
VEKGGVELGVVTQRFAGMSLIAAALEAHKNSLAPVDGASRSKFSIPVPVYEKISGDFVSGKFIPHERELDGPR